MSGWKRVQKRNTEIAKLVQQGKIYDEIAKDFGLSSSRVGQIARRAGAISIHSRDRYTNMESLGIVAAHKRGFRPASIADMTGRSSEGIRKHLTDLGVFQPAWQPWPDDEEDFLRRHYKTKGWSAAKIAVKLGRTRNEVIGKAHRLGLSKPVGRAA
jgi:hypothetical protein